MGHRAGSRASASHTHPRRRYWVRACPRAPGRGCWWSAGHGGATGPHPGSRLRPAGERKVGGYKWPGAVGARATHRCPPRTPALRAWCLRHLRKAWVWGTLLPVRTLPHRQGAGTPRLGDDQRVPWTPTPQPDLLVTHSPALPGRPRFPPAKSGRRPHRTPSTPRNAGPPFRGWHCQ